MAPKKADKAEKPAKEPKAAAKAGKAEKPAKKEKKEKGEFAQLLRGLLGWGPRVEAAGHAICGPAPGFSMPCSLSGA